MRESDHNNSRYAILALCVRSAIEMISFGWSTVGSANPLADLSPKNFQR